jgi:hypothetical protein
VLKYVERERLPLALTGLAGSGGRLLTVPCVMADAATWYPVVDGWTCPDRFVCSTGAEGVPAARESLPREMVAATIRTIFAQTTGDAVRTQLNVVADMLGWQFSQVKTMLLNAATDITAFADFPPAHWKKIWSTNPLERLNREIKRRADVVQVFPNPAPLDRPAAAFLAELHDEWQVFDRRYLSEGSMTELLTANPTEDNRPLPPQPEPNQLGQ